LYNTVSDNSATSLALMGIAAGPRSYSHASPLRTIPVNSCLVFSQGLDDVAQVYAVSVCLPISVQTLPRHTTLSVLSDPF
jgi:hypothetical protein